MHCLLIHQAFIGPSEAGGTRHYDLSRMLAEKGHQFTIVTSNRSYLTGAPRQRVSLLGPEGNEESVRVLAAWTPATVHRSFVWRVVAFLVFMWTSVWKALWVPGVDLVMGTSPPIFQAVSAWLVAALRRRPFLLEIRDLWPEFAVDMGVLKNPVLIGASRWLENFLYRRADHLVVNSPAYREYLLGKGVAPGKISVVPNGVDPELFDPRGDGRELRRRLGITEDEFVVTYAGALGMANDIPTILRAAARLQGEERLRFLIVGDGKERPALERMLDDLGVSNVLFPGPMPKDMIPELLAASNACVATLLDIPMFTTTYPNKVFDYMAAGRPVVLGIDGVIRDVVERAGAGIFVPPGDDGALAGAVEALARDRKTAQEMGRRGREYVLRHFDRREQSRIFGEVLRGVAG